MNSRAQHDDHAHRERHQLRHVGEVALAVALARPLVRPRSPAWPPSRGSSGNMLKIPTKMFSAASRNSTPKSPSVVADRAADLRDADERRRPASPGPRSRRSGGSTMLTGLSTLTRPLVDSHASGNTSVTLDVAASRCPSTPTRRPAAGDAEQRGAEVRIAGGRVGAEADVDRLAGAVAQDDDRRRRHPARGSAPRRRGRRRRRPGCRRRSGWCRRHGCRRSPPGRPGTAPAPSAPGASTSSPLMA